MKTIDILIFGGQSNMQGQSEICSESDPVIGASEYHLITDSLVPLCNPVGENIRFDGTQGGSITPETNLKQWLSEHVLGAACYGHTNLVPSFCRAYIRESNREVIAVHAAKGSTMIDDWLPGTAGYAKLVEKAGAAIRKAKDSATIGHIYFIWLQGESDAIFRCTQAQYEEKIAALGDALHRDLAIDRFGIIRVGCFTNDERDWEIIRAQDAVCRTNELFLMLTDIAVSLNKNPLAMHPSIGGHYSAAGLEMLGQAGGETLGRSMTSSQK